MCCLRNILQPWTVHCTTRSWKARLHFKSGNSSTNHLHFPKTTNSWEWMQLAEASTWLVTLLEIAQRRSRASSSVPHVLAGEKTNSDMCCISSVVCPYRLLFSGDIWTSMTSWSRTTSLPHQILHINCISCCMRTGRHIGRTWLHVLQGETHHCNTNGAGWTLSEQGVWIEPGYCNPVLIGWPAELEVVYCW